MSIKNKLTTPTGRMNSSCSSSFSAPLRWPGTTETSSPREEAARKEHERKAKVVPPTPPADRLNLIKKLAKRKKRKVGNDSAINRLLKEVDSYSETPPDKITY